VVAPLTWPMTWPTPKITTVEIDEPDTVDVSRAIPAMLAEVLDSPLTGVVVARANPAIKAAAVEVPLAVFGCVPTIKADTFEVPDAEADIRPNPEIKLPLDATAADCPKTIALPRNV
jgi:hypothetical protein